MADNAEMGPEVYLGDSPFDEVEFADNPEPRIPVALIVDRSGSMYGDGIRAVNDAIARFKADVSQDPVASLRAEIALVAFDHTTDVHDFVLVQDFNPPTLTAGGGTKMSVAVIEALDLLAQRKQTYRDNGISYYRPFAVLITDGYPEHDTRQQVAEAQARIVSEEAGRHVAFFTFGVEGANMDALSQITPPNRPPKYIGDASQIVGLIEWLSNSVKQISASQPGEALRLAPVEDYLDY